MDIFFDNCISIKKENCVWKKNEKTTCNTRNCSHGETLKSFQYRYKIDQRKGILECLQKLQASVYVKKTRANNNSFPIENAWNKTKAIWNIIKGDRQTKKDDDHLTAEEFSNYFCTAVDSVIRGIEDIEIHPLNTWNATYRVV